MSTTPVTLDMSTATPIGNPEPTPPALALQGAVSYAATQNPDQYAKRLQLQKQTGIGPQLSEGNEEAIRQIAAARALDPNHFAATAPKTTAWASDPDNAAVSGVDALHKLGGIEANAGLMDHLSAYNPSFFETLKDTIRNGPIGRSVQSTMPAVASALGITPTQTEAEDQRTAGNADEVVNLRPLLENARLPNVPFMRDIARANSMQSQPLVQRLGMGIASVASGLTTPVNMAFLAGSGGVGLLPDASQAVAARLVSGAFSGQMMYGLYQLAPGFKEAMQRGDYGTAAEIAGQMLGTSVMALAAGKDALFGHYHAQLGQAVEAVNSPEMATLKDRAPDQFNDAINKAVGDGPSLRIPVDAFNEHFTGQKLDPGTAANLLGSTNYVEAHMSGGDVEVPKAGFLSKLPQDQQEALLPHVVDPVTGLSPTQFQESKDFEASGGAEKLQADAAEADAETASSPEYSQVKEELHQRYVAAGETPEVADALSTKDANVYTNLARQAGMKPSELMSLYNPKVVSGEPSDPTLYQSKPPIDGTDGKETTLLTPSREIRAKYRLVEADSLQPSHNAINFKKNPAYPEGVQERAYDTSKEAQNRVIQQGQNYDPRYTVNTNPDAVNGPPVITPDGVVLGGNSRAMSTQRHYAEGGEAYRDALKEQAGAYGFTPEQVDAMNKPVLVRQVGQQTTMDETRRLGSELNKSMTGAMGVSERAVSAGKNLKPETLQNVAGMMQADDSTLREAMGKHGSAIVKMLTSDGVITDRERPQYVDPSTGGLSEEGKTFVERALMGSVIDDPRLMDAAPKAVLNKLERSLGSIASFASRPDEWNLLPAIRDAVSELGVIQRSGNSVETHLGQTDMFGGDRNPLVDTMIRSLDGKPNAVRVAFENFAHDADQNLPGQSRMFGEANAFDAFNHAFGSKLTEQEYHDGLEEAAAKAPVPTQSSNAQSDEGVSGSADTLPSHGGEGSPQDLAPEGTRGWFRTLPDGSFEIGKTKIGDLSTFVHEPAHSYLFMLRDLASREGSSDVLKSDYGKILDFLGARDGEALTTEQHEKWARANEQYLREGRAPSKSLKGTFQRFATWLGSVYKKATDLGVELSPEIRGVFDRLHAAEEGVNRAADEAGPQLFKTPEEAGWTDEQFKSYAEAKGMEVEQAKADILGKLNEAAVRDRSDAWREEEANVRQGVTDTVDAKPEYKAIRSLRKGEMPDGTPLTMDKASLVEQFGEERVKELQKQHPGLYRNEGGIDPETAAEMLGFRSAEQMVKAIEASPRRSQAIETGTREIMTAKHGDIRYDGSLKDKSDLAVMNEQRANNLHKELTALNRRNTPEFELRTAEQELKRQLKSQLDEDQARETKAKAKDMESLANVLLKQTDAQREQIAARDQKIVDLKEKIEKLKEDAKQAAQEDKAGTRFAQATAPIASYREAARQMIDSKAPADLDPTRYLDASRKYARESFDALAKSDYWGAKQAKHKELLNHFLYREAMNAKDTHAKDVAFYSRILGASDKKIGSTRSVDLVNAARTLLSALRVVPSAAGENMEGALDGLKQYNPDLYNELAPDINAAIQKGANGARQMSMGDLKDLRQTIDTLWHRSRRDMQVMIDGRLAYRANVVHDLNTRLGEIGPREHQPGVSSAITGKDQFISAVDSVRTAARRMEHWADSMDGAGGPGPFTRALVRPVIEALADFRLQRVEHMRQYSQILEGIEAKKEKIEAPELGYTFGAKNGGVGKYELLGAIMHTGNPSNMAKLLVGRGWGEMGTGGELDTSRWDEFMQRMYDAGTITKNDMDAVQKVWDLNESMKPLAQKTYHDLYGYYFKEVEHGALQTPFGEYRGGYVPAKVDPDMVRDGQRNQKMEDLESDFRNSMPSTGAGFTIARKQNYNKALSLDLRLIGKHIDDTLRFAMVQPSIRDALSIMRDRSFADTLGKVDPQAMEGMMLPYLNRAARQISSEPGMFPVVDKFWNVIRQRVGAATMMGNVANALVHIPNGFLTAVKAGYGNTFRSSAAFFMGDPTATTAAVIEKSPYMKTRLDEQMKKISRSVNNILENKGPIGKAQDWGIDHAYFLQHSIWNINDVIAWHAGFNKAMDDIGTKMTPDLAEKEAILRADATVRLTQGADNPEDIPRFMAATPFLKTLLQFSGWSNNVANLNLSEGAKAVQGGWSSAAPRLGVLILTMVAMNTIGDGMVAAARGQFDTDEPMLPQILEWFFGAQARSATSMIPFGGVANAAVGSVYAATQGHFAPNMNDRITNSPTSTMLQSATVGTGRAIHDAFADDKVVTGQDVHDVLTLAGLITKTPALSALGSRIGYQMDVDQGRVNPTSDADYLRGLVTGSASAGSRKK